MGPIERELRRCPIGNREIMDWLWRGDTSDLAFDMVIAACERLGLSPDPYGYSSTYLRAKALPDVMSDAIEAAEALGL